MACSKCFSKSTTIIANTQTLLPNNDLQFAYATKECNYIYLKNNEIVFSEPGTYLVTFNASGTGTVGATTPVLQLQNNGSSLTGISASVTEAENTSVGAMNFNTVINVKHSCSSVDNTARLSVINTGASANITNAMISIIKVAP